MTFGPNFYATIAQIIPVFWLALIVESRVRQRPGVGRLESALFGAISFLAGLVEACAIYLMATSSPPHAAGVAVFAAVCLLIYSMVFLSLGRTTPQKSLWAVVGAVCIFVPIDIILHIW